MADVERKRRSCPRFEIPGTTVNYKKAEIYSFDKLEGEENCPVLDLSLNGLRFLSQEELFLKRNLYLKIFIPDDNRRLYLKGQVIWTGRNPGDSYKYQNGVEFDKNWIEEEQSAAKDFEIIQILEKKYCA